MGPKKEVKQEKILLGRPGNHLKSGIVGLANVGKSTLFQAITRCSLGNPANFPYATIDPEEAKVIVPDERYDWLCDHYKPKSRVPANLTIYDIAGLTKGSSTGAGLGNAFLSHIRAVDAIFQVVRCFDDAEIIHIEGDVDPTRDLDIISHELRTKDIEFVEKAHENLVKQTRRGGQSLEMKKLREEQACVEKVLEMLKAGKDVRKGNWSPKEVCHFLLFCARFSRFFFMMNKSICSIIPALRKAHIGGSSCENVPADLTALLYDALTLLWLHVHRLTKGMKVETINPLFLLTAKPVVYLVNLSERDYVRQKNKHLPAIAQWVKAQGEGTGGNADPVIPVSVSYESRLSLMESPEEEEKEQEKVGAKSALPKIITQMRKSMDLGSFFTTGTDEVRQWTLRNNTKAPAAAGVIHGDFEKTFIQAIVYNYSVLKEEGDEASVKAKGKVMTKGKDYEVQDGDILLIKAGAAKG